MSDTGKSGSSGSPIGFLAILLLILSATGTLIEPLTSTRPDPSEQSGALHSKANDMTETRLWQDPIELMNQRFANNPVSPCDYRNTLRDELKAFHRYKNFSVVAVSVSGSAYHEITETRLRNRFAVVSALNSADYYPGYGDKLGYYKLNSVSCDKAYPTTIIPYEWFDRTEEKSSSILVLWLDESKMQASPGGYKQFFNQLIGELENEWLGIWETEQPYSPNYSRNPSYKLIGPSGSSLLVSLLKGEPMITPDSDIYPRFKLFAHSATAPAKKIIKALQADCVANSTEWYCRFDEKLTPLSEMALEKTLHEALEQRSIIRSIGTDDKLITALLWELWNRGLNNTGRVFSFVDPVSRPGCADGLVLITELDTLYARSLASYIEQDQFWQHCNQDGNQPLPVKRFSYLRGVDGKLPSVPDKSSGYRQSVETNKNSPMQWDDAAPEYAEGRNQFDYLRRLTEIIAQLDRDKSFAAHGVKAIGILGSDVYDKLVILHALRERFQDKIFFTTDLDARFLHADQLKWTRNLIVASNFDFMLRADWQKNSMPFRDSYQTSIYNAVSLALREIDDGERIWTQAVVSQSQKPQLFEIGRKKAVHLDSPHVCELDNWIQSLAPASMRRIVSQECTVQISSDLTDGKHKIFDIFTNEPDRSLITTSREEIVSGGFTIVLIIIVALCGYYLLMRRIGLVETQRSDVYASVRKLAANKYSWFGVLLWMVAVAALCAVLIAEDVYEPIMWLEGISVWPNLTIGFTGIFIVFLASWYGYERLRQTKSEIDSEFFNISAGVVTNNPNGRGANPAIDTPAAWKNYRCLTRGFWPGIAVAASIAVVLTLSFLLLDAFKSMGSLNFPYRGNFVYYFHNVLLLVQFLLLWGLVFWIGAEAKACKRLVDTIKESINTEHVLQQWSGHILETVEKGTGVSQKHLHRYLQFLVAVKISEGISRLIYLPLGMILIILIARSRIFDQFDISWSLIIVFSIAVIYPLFRIYQLRQSAESLRNSFLSDYEAQQVSLTVKQAGDTAQVERVIALIRNEHKGIYATVGHQPALAALLLPFGGMSGVQIIEYLFNI
ncbi:MAG: hypothetical protein DYH15_00055 [Nitrosomonas sp. PRO4]|nr:hypothetical protein [Nitrosomonas sp. PRO4]